MMQVKNIRVGLVLFAALSGVGMCGTASALPEVVVGSRPVAVIDSSIVLDASAVEAQAQSVDQATSEDSDPNGSDDDAETASN